MNKKKFLAFEKVRKSGLTKLNDIIIMAYISHLYAKRDTSIDLLYQK